MCRIPLIVAVVILSLGSAARAQYVQVGVPLEQLPQKHEYQKKLRQFLATLTEKDFDVERKEITVASRAR